MYMYQHIDGAEGVVKAIEEVAEKRGISMAQVALAWVMGKKEVSAPIIGTTSLDNLKDLIGMSDEYLLRDRG
jgi:aryl-alcohol dehydrogenase-like predicted oxidoreductase